MIDLEDTTSEDSSSGESDDESDEEITVVERDLKVPEEDVKPDLASLQERLTGMGAKVVSADLDQDVHMAEETIEAPSASTGLGLTHLDVPSTSFSSSVSPTPPIPGFASTPALSADTPPVLGPVSTVPGALATTDTTTAPVVTTKKKRKRTPSPSPPPAPVKPDITLRLEHTLNGPGSEFSLYDRAYEMEFYDEDVMENFSLRGMLGGLWAEDEVEEGEPGEETEEERLAREFEERYDKKVCYFVSFIIIIRNLRLPFGLGWL